MNELKQLIKIRSRDDALDDLKYQQPFRLSSFTLTDVCRDPAQTGRPSVIVFHDDEGRLDPDDVSVPGDPTKLLSATLAAREPCASHARGLLFVIRMDDCEPEVRRRQPLLDGVTEH